RRRFMRGDPMTNQDGDTEAVCAPLVRIEAMLHPTPQFQHLEEAACGETQPCVTGPFASAITPDPVERFESLFLRPGMYLGNENANLRDLLIFVRGASYGLAPVGGHAFRAVC